MKAFLSYSLNDTDQYILTLLSSELRKKGFSIKQSNDFHSEISPLTKVNVNQSQLFIGILTGDGEELERVQKEYRIASTAGVPSIYLIENTVDINSKFNLPHIIFNRFNPQTTIDELNMRIEQRKNEQNQDSSSNMWAWILGGAALLAVLALLTKKDK